MLVCDEEKKVGNGCCVSSQNSFRGGCWACSVSGVKKVSAVQVARACVDIPLRDGTTMRFGSTMRAARLLELELVQL